MRVLSFDQSTRVTGYALFVDHKYQSSGIIDLHKIEDTEERSRQMGIAICKQIECAKPDVIVIEEVQQQSNPDTLKKLARIQGIAIGFAAAHNIPLHILEPSKWRAALHYKQGRGVARKELKQQSLDFVSKKFWLKLKEDEAEAVCIGEAAHRIFDWSFEDDWGI